MPTCRTAFAREVYDSDEEIDSLIPIDRVHPGYNEYCDCYCYGYRPYDLSFQSLGAIALSGALGYTAPTHPAQDRGGMPWNRFTVCRFACLCPEPEPCPPQQPCPPNQPCPPAPQCPPMPPPPQPCPTAKPLSELPVFWIVGSIAAGAMIGFGWARR